MGASTGDHSILKTVTIATMKPPIAPSIAYAWTALAPASGLAKNFVHENMAAASTIRVSNPVLLMVP